MIQKFRYLARDPLLISILKREYPINNINNNLLLLDGPPKFSLPSLASSDVPSDASNDVVIAPGDCNVLIAIPSPTSHDVHNDTSNNVSSNDIPSDVVVAPSDVLIATLIDVSPSDGSSVVAPNDVSDVVTSVAPGTPPSAIN